MSIKIEEIQEDQTEKPESDALEEAKAIVDSAVQLANEISKPEELGDDIYRAIAERTDDVTRILLERIDFLERSIFEGLETLTNQLQTIKEGEEKEKEALEDLADGVEMLAEEPPATEVVPVLEEIEPPQENEPKKTRHWL